MPSMPLARGLVPVQTPLPAAVGEAEMARATSVSAAARTAMEWVLRADVEGVVVDAMMDLRLRSRSGRGGSLMERMTREAGRSLLQGLPGRKGGIASSPHRAR